MKRFKALVASSIIAVTALATGLTMSAIAHDDDDEVSETRDVAVFTEVVLEGAMDIAINVGASQSVVISGDKEMVGLIETEVRGDTLYLRQDFDNWPRRRRSRDFYVEISVASLDGITVRGAGDIEIEGIDSDNFGINIDGAGDLSLEGKCIDLNIEIDGAGDIDAEDLKCQNVAITINGAGDADIYASESVKARLNGVGDITIYGNPSDVERRVRGLGEIELANND